MEMFIKHQSFDFIKVKFVGGKLGEKKDAWKTFDCFLVIKGPREEYYMQFVFLSFSVSGQINVTLFRMTAVGCK